MRRTIRRLTGLALALVMAAGLMAIPGAAVETVTATIDPTLNIVIDGQKRTFFNAQGQQVHPAVYSGTTYLPLRAIGELMGKNVNWDGATFTATLSSPRVTDPVAGTPDVNPVKQTITGSLRDDYKIVVDGIARTFYDGNGKQVFPLIYNGVTYLPIRSIGELMGKTVSWDQSTYTAVLSGGEVTDADTFNSNPPQVQPGTQNGIITADQAKQVALEHAGLTASQVTFVEQKLEMDDGRQVYEIEFYTGSFTEFDYEIDAKTGAIISFDQDAEFYTPAPKPGQGSQGNQGNQGNQGSQTTITLDQAKQIALQHASLTASQVTFTTQKLDRDDGRQVYEIEFYTSDYTEYDYEIDAVTGSVISYDKDAESYSPSPAPGQGQQGQNQGQNQGQQGQNQGQNQGQQGQNQGQGSSGIITADQAKQIALGRVDGATAANITKCKLDRDDGIQVYEIEIRVGRMEYEIEINAATGAVLSFDADD